ncbi:MAG: hypothetical protein DRH43_08275 [Deltaproteobacteria bacterium]|nr:MAG: hypothetical protein DRH43_08275 [Deltaproteobacteria bacterium]
MKIFIAAIAITLLLTPPNRAVAKDILYSSYQSGNWEVWIVDSQGNRPRQLTRTSEEERYPAWSPDRKKIAYATNTGKIYLMDRDGKNKKLLTGISGKCDQPAWRPKTNKLTFVSFTYRKGEHSDIREIDTETSNKPVKIVSKKGVVNFPAWSPDGNRLVYALFHRGPFQQVIEELWIKDAIAETESPLIQSGQENFQPDWSPDGRSIVFASNTTGDYEIWVFYLDPARLVRLTDSPGFDGDPCWSPDGRKIAFVSTRSGKKQIWIMDKDGRNPHQLTRGRYESRDPDW